jgi:hypothetical protein
MLHVYAGNETMRTSKKDYHSFIVRVRLEPRELDGADSELRGNVEHVGSGEHKSVKDLNMISSFIAAYLPGIKASNAKESIFLRILKMCKSSLIRRN